MKTFFLSGFLFLTYAVVYSQPSGHRIELKLKNYNQNEVFLGYRLGDKAYLKDTVMVSDSKAVFADTAKLDKGIYMIVSSRDNNYVEFLIDGNDQEFFMEIDFSGFPRITDVRGSVENSDFNSYLQFLTAKRTQLDSLNRQVGTPGIEEAKKQAIQLRIDQLEKSIRQYQTDYIGKTPKTLMAQLIKAIMPLSPPAFTGTEQEKGNKEYRWYKEHWFDNINMTHPGMIRTPVLAEKIDYYLDKMTVQHPDSIIQSVDEVLSRVEAATETYRFFVARLLNKYANHKYVGMDAVYVHIALKYYDKGRAPWVEKDQLKKIVENARRLEPLLIGKKAPDLDVNTLQGERTTLWDFAADYTVLFFWSIDCRYCKESIKPLRDAEKQFRSKGVKVFTFWMHSNNESETDCQRFISENNMQDFFNTLDKSSTDQYRKRYDLNTTPQIYILDKNKIIRIKKIGADQLKQVLESFMKEG